MGNTVTEEFERMKKTVKGIFMLKNKKLFLFDIDGTIAVGNTLYEGSAELIDYIEKIGGKAYYITNNSTKSNADYVAKFKKEFGLDTTEDQFVTSGFMTIRFLKKQFEGKKIFVLGTASFVTELKKNGLIVTEKPEADIACVLVGYDSELTYEKLVNTCQVLSTMDVPFYGTNPDLCCPIDFGFIPDCGSICQMLTSSTGKEPVYLGKPAKEVCELCMEHSGFSKEETLVVGDRLYTDIACGINAGVETCVVYTGEATPDEVAGSVYKPDYAFADIREFFEALKTSSFQA